MYRDSNYDPPFGSGFDMLISNACNKNNKSFVNLPGFFYRQVGIKLERNKEIFSILAGGKHFKVSEYEMFKLVNE